MEIGVEKVGSCDCLFVDVVEDVVCLFVDFFEVFGVRVVDGFYGVYGFGYDLRWLGWGRIVWLGGERVDNVVRCVLIGCVKEFSL